MIACAREILCYTGSRVCCVGQTSPANPALSSPSYSHALSFVCCRLFTLQGCLRGDRRHRGNVRVSQEGKTNLPTQELCEDRFQGKDNIPILVIARSTSTNAKGTSYRADKRLYRNSIIWFDPFYISTGGGTQFVHDRSHMTIDPRIPTVPERTTTVFHQPGRNYRGGGGACSLTV